ncbi:MAG: hypothetical protein JWQ38_2040 [Flavipsychrobacter sp.]|nr:hypothetical protein [Flavipsychrobacter sp.]
MLISGKIVAHVYPAEQALFCSISASVLLRDSNFNCGTTSGFFQCMNHGFAGFRELHGIIILLYSGLYSLTRLRKLPLGLKKLLCRPNLLKYKKLTLKKVTKRLQKYPKRLHLLSFAFLIYSQVTAVLQRSHTNVKMAKEKSMIEHFLYYHRFFLIRGSAISDTFPMLFRKVLVVNENQLGDERGKYELSDSLI